MAFLKNKIREARRPDHSPFPKALAITGLAVLGAAAITLAAIAMGSGSDAEAPSAAATPPTFGAPKVTEKPVEPTPEPPKTVTVDAPQRVLVAGQEPGHLLRAATPGCGAGNGMIEYSFDDGASWQAVNFTDSPGAAVQQIDASNPEIVRVAYLDENCDLQGARSYTGGSGWEPEPAAAATWMLQGDGGATFSPAGQVALPCTAVSVSGAGNTGIALCSDSHITVSADAGQTWSTPVLVPGASVVSSSSAGAFVAAVGAPECSGISVSSTSAEGVTPAGSCLPSETGPAAVALASTPTSLVLWVGDQLLRSADVGVSWL